MASNSFKEIYKIVMPEKKRKEERFNIFAHWFGRPISILITLPLLKTNIKPTTITKWSIFFAVIGFGLVSFGRLWFLKLIGWFFFLFWNLFDGVDGNLARCKDMCSENGDLWDTVAGYIAMVLTYFSAGIAAYYEESVFPFFDNYWLLIIGGATAIMSIFPRLVLHKKKSYGHQDNEIDSFTKKENFGLKNILAMNLISPSGFMQIIFLLCIVFNVLNFFICFYFVINLAILVLSLYKLMKE